MTRQFAHRARRVHERQDGAVVAAQEGFALHVHRPHDACARGAAREQAPIRAHVALLVGGLAANIVNRMHDGGELCPRGAGGRVRWGRWWHKLWNTGENEEVETIRRSNDQKIK